MSPWTTPPDTRALLLDEGAPLGLRRAIWGLYGPDERHPAARDVGRWLAAVEVVARAQRTVSATGLGVWTAARVLRHLTAARRAAADAYAEINRAGWGDLACGHSVHAWQDGRCEDCDPGAGTAA